MKSFFHEAIGYVATKHTRAYIYTAASVGLMITLTLFGFIGFALGNPFGYGSEGMSIAFALVAFNMFCNIELIHSDLEMRVDAIEALKQELL